MLILFLSLIHFQEVYEMSFYDNRVYNIPIELSLFPVIKSDNIITLRVDWQCGIKYTQAYQAHSASFL